MKKSTCVAAVCLPLVLSGLPVAWAPAAASTPASAIFVGSDGSDGAFVASPGTMTIDLGLATTGPWDTTPGTGNGVYDPAVWAVVFKFTTVDVLAGATVNFINHPSRAPVVWLAQGDVIVQGTIDLSGSAGTWIPLIYAEPGPGGFRGGIGSLSGLNESAGFGPGGGQLLTVWNFNGGGGSYGTTGVGFGPGATYGSGTAFPMIGGSGGAAGNKCCKASGGGGGGGAIVVASDTLVHFQDGSRLWALGGSVGGSIGVTSGQHGGGASGGAIRIVSDVVQVDSSAVLAAAGGPAAGGSAANGGGAGRVRIEGNQLTIIGQPTPGHTEGPPGQILPDSTSPTLFAVSLDDGVQIYPVPSDPSSAFEALNADVSLGMSGTVILNIGAANVPAGTQVEVHVIPIRADQDRQIFFSDPPHLMGPQTGLSATASLTLFGGVSAIQLRAVLP